MVGQVTVSVAAAVVALPQALVKTARYWLPLWDDCAVNVRLVVVAPGMSLKPEPVSTCHCTVGAGLPEAEAVKVAVVFSHTVVLAGSAVTAGAVFTVSVAGLLLVDPQASVKTARYCLPLSPAAAVNDR